MHRGVLPTCRGMIYQLPATEADPFRSALAVGGQVRLRAAGQFQQNDGCQIIYEKKFSNVQATWRTRRPLISPNNLNNQKLPFDSCSKHLKSRNSPFAEMEFTLLFIK
jgi:hypothetical protein